MAEGTQGEIDGVVTSSQVEKEFSSSQFTSAGHFLNYSRVEELYQNEYNLSPRKQFCGIQMGADTTNLALSTQQDYDNWKAQFDPVTGLPTRKQAYNSSIALSYKGCLMLWDTQREQDVKLGRSYNYPPLEYGECNINAQYKEIFEIKEGDIVYFDITMPQFLNSIIEKYNSYALQNSKTKMTYFGDATHIRLPCKVKRFTTGTKGKYPNTDIIDQQSMELGPFLQLVSQYLPKSAQNNTDFVSYLKDTSLVDAQEFSDVFIMTLPEPRVSYYESSDYDQIQRGVTKYANKVTDALGYFPIKISLAILEEMENYSTAVIFLGLIFDIIILLFIIISILLIYSLLMISVETKTFEIGVMRMVGLSKNGLIFMIFIQGIMFVLPAIITAFALSFAALKGIYSFLFTADLGINVQPVPDAVSVLQAIFLGLCIPILSSILPIRQVLTKNLNDALDYQRSKTQATYIEIIDKNKNDITSYVLFGVMSVIYGLAIYYFLPLAMLSLNFSMILKIFFFILVGMLFGLSLLAFNIQRILEIIFTHVFLVFETASMKMLVLKNLTAHKMRNKFTSIIYSLALGFIIFLIVSYTLQLQSAQLIVLKKRGAKLLLSSDDGYSLSPTDVDPILQSHADIIDSFAYITFDLERVFEQDLSSLQYTDRSKINAFDVAVYGVTPYIFDATVDNFLQVRHQDPNSGLSLAEQLYTARGSQGVGVGGQVAKKIGLEQADDRYNQTGMLIISGDKRNIYYQKRAIFTTDSAPAFTMSGRSGSSSQKESLLVSLPMFMKLSGMNSIDMMYERLLIKMKNPDNSQDYDTLTQSFRTSFSSSQYSSIKIQDQTEDEATNDQVKTILDIVFNSIIIITMFLCFFSLSSSMSANLFEQSKEIGVLRAIGVKRHRITMLYVYEAFILVISSSLLGILIGTIVGFTMTVQQALFTSIPITFYFPWVQFLIILAITIICAFASTVGPTRSLMKLEISHIFRLN